MSFFLSKSFRIPNRNLALAGLPRNRSPVRALPAVSRAPAPVWAQETRLSTMVPSFRSFATAWASGVALGMVCQL